MTMQLPIRHTIEEMTKFRGNIPGIDKESMTLAINQYNDIVNSATEIATITHLRDSIPKHVLKEKRDHIIELLRISSEQEELALSYIQKAATNIRK